MGRGSRAVTVAVRPDPPTPRLWPSPPALGAAPYRPWGPSRAVPDPPRAARAPARGRRRRGGASSSGRGNIAAERTATRGGRGSPTPPPPRAAVTANHSSGAPRGNDRAGRGAHSGGPATRGGGGSRPLLRPSTPRPARRTLSPHTQLGERPPGRSPLGFPSGSDPCHIHKPIPFLWAP